MNPAPNPDSNPAPSPGSPAAVQELLDRAAALGRIPEGIATAEEAVRQADALGDPALSYQAREVLIENATFGGAPEKLLVAFSWCLAHADRDPNWDPDSWQAMSLLWRYKWVVTNALDFPGITRARIFEMLDDFRRRSLAAGYNERTTFDLRFSLERRMGNFAAAQTWLDRVRALERDGLADCHACEIDSIVAFLAETGRHDEAIREADPILQGGLGCAEIPHKTHACLLESFLATGRPDDAALSHAAGYKLIRHGRAFVKQHAEHLRYLVQIGKVDKAAGLLRKHLPWALEGRSGEERFEFLLATRSLLRRLDHDGVRSIRLKLDPDLCPAAGRTTVATRELLVWTEATLRDLAAQFDTRNQSLWFASRVLDENAGPAHSRAA